MTLHAVPLRSVPAVVVSGLRRSYGARNVIDRLDLQIDRGEFVALLGEGGCGKTALLRALAGLDPVQGGQIDAPRRPAVVFQEHRLLNGREAEYIAQQKAGYSDVIRDQFIALKRSYRLYPVDDREFVGNLQKAADWLVARKVLPEPVTVAEHLAQL